MGGSEITKKAATPQEDSVEFVPSFCVVGLGSVVSRARVLVHEVLDNGAQAAARGAARFASQVLGRGAQADARGAAQVLDRGIQAVACGAAQILDRGAQPDPPVVCCRYLFVAPGRCPRRCAGFWAWCPGRCPRRRVRRRYLIVLPRPMPAAPLVVFRR